MKVVGENEVKIQLKESTGPMGPAGPQGPQGEAGPVGPRGATGPAGATGPKGDKGDPFKYSDFTSAQLEALRGPQGETGPQGATGPQGPTGATGAAGKNGTNGVSASHSWNGTVLTVSSASGTSSADLRGPQGPQGPKGDPGSGGGSVDLDTTLTQSGKAADAKATGEAIAKKVNGSDLAAVAKSGSYEDLKNKPTIPAAYTLPVATETKLGGVKPAAKTDEMTQAVGVDEFGGLWAPPGGGGGTNDVVLIDVTTEERVLHVEHTLESDTPFSRIYGYIYSCGHADNSKSEYGITLRVRTATGAEKTIPTGLKIAQNTTWRYGKFIAFLGKNGMVCMGHSNQNSINGNGLSGANEGISFVEGDFSTMKSGRIYIGCDGYGGNTMEAGTVIKVYGG